MVDKALEKSNKASTDAESAAEAVGMAKKAAEAAAEEDPLGADAYRRCASAAEDAKAGCVKASEAYQASERVITRCERAMHHTM